MRITANMNLKGGVAKTTTVVNMAVIMASKGKRVLVIDGDAQCNTTEFLTGEECCRAYATMADVLTHGKRYLIETQNTKLEGVSLIAGDESLMDLDLTKAEDGKIDLQCLFLRRRLWREMEIDYVLIDCPPAFSAATAAAMLAADDVIIPIKLDAFSLRGMANLTRQIRNMQEINPALRIAGLLPTMVYSSPKISQALEILHYSDFNIYPVIRKTNKVDDMTFAQCPLIESSPRSSACVDYRRFVKKYLQEEGGADRG